MDRSLRNILLYSILGLVVISFIVYFIVVANQDQRSFQAQDVVAPAVPTKQGGTIGVVDNIDFLGRACDAYILQDRRDIEVVINGFIASIQSSDTASIVIDSIRKRSISRQSVCAYTITIGDVNYYSETTYSPLDWPYTRIYNNSAKNSELYAGPNDH